MCLRTCWAKNFHHQQFNKALFVPTVRLTMHSVSIRGESDSSSSCAEKLQRCAKKQSRFLSNIIFILCLMSTINLTHLPAVIKSLNEHFDLSIFALPPPRGCKIFSRCRLQTFELFYLHIFMASWHVGDVTKSQTMTSLWRYFPQGLCRCTGARVCLEWR